MRKGLRTILCMFVILHLLGMTVCAADTGSINENTVKKNTVLQIEADVELHEEPDISSDITATLAKGTPVIITEDPEDGWCKVSYQEEKGYIQISFLMPLGNQEVLDDEFKGIKEENQLAYEEAEMAKKHITSARIWGTVIVVLVIAIFGVGIVSALRKEHKKA